MAVKEWIESTVRLMKGGMMEAPSDILLCFLV